MHLAMSDEAIRRQIESCESTKGTDKFVYFVEALLNMLPEGIRAEVEKDPHIYKDEESYINRFINNALISVEFVTNKVVDPEALYSVILEKIRK